MPDFTSSAILWFRRSRLPHLESLVRVFLEIPYNSWKATGCLTHVSPSMEVFILGALAQPLLVLFFSCYTSLGLKPFLILLFKELFPKLIEANHDGAGWGDLDDSRHEPCKEAAGSRLCTDLTHGSPCG